MKLLNTSTTSRGGGVINTTPSIQSLASLSTEMAAHGIYIRFASSTTNSIYSQENFSNNLINGGCARIDLPEKNNPTKYNAEKNSGRKTFFDYNNLKGMNPSFYTKKFASLVHAFSFEYSLKYPWEKNLVLNNVQNKNTNANGQQMQQGFIVFNQKTEGNPCDSTAMNCSWDTRGFIFDSADIVKTGKVYYGKYQPDTTIPDYYDVAYAEDNVNLLIDDYDKSKNILPGCPIADGCSQAGKSLYYYVYYPMHNYEACPLPVVILFHAGGFSDCSQLNYEDDLCRMIARKGFIVINVEYRRGRIKDTIGNQNIYTAVQQTMANYRAFQDGRGAIRTIILDQRNIATNHLPYRIDTNNVNIAGQSAGGMIATNLCLFTTQAQIDSVFQSPAGLKKISTALGSIDADFYRGTPDIEFHSKIKTLWCMWGAVPIPMPVSNAHDEYNFLTRNGTVPLIPSISFMGAEDVVFPPKRKNQFVYYPPTTHYQYTTETGCMIDPPFELSSQNGTKKQFRLECTYDLYTLSNANNVPAMIFIDCDMGHGLDHDTDINALLNSNFGLSSVPPTLAAINNYMASRFTFFARAKYIGLWDSLLGPSKFIDCEDYRHGCTKYADHCDTLNSNCSDNFVGE